MKSFEKDIALVEIIRPILIGHRFRFGIFQNQTHVIYIAFNCIVEYP
jgi:hypothetical protein